MGTRPLLSIHVGFFTTLLVCVPSYYFCVRKRDYKERLIEVMMRANDFQEAKEMPPQAPAGKDHPFLDPVTAAIADADATAIHDFDTSSSSYASDTGRSSTIADKEFVAHLPERKEWQTQVPQQDAKDVFVERK